MGQFPNVLWAVTGHHVQNGADVEPLVSYACGCVASRTAAVREEHVAIFGAKSALPTRRVDPHSVAHSSVHPAHQLRLRVLCTTKLGALCTTMSKTKIRYNSLTAPRVPLGQWRT